MSRLRYFLSALTFLLAALPFPTSRVEAYPVVPLLPAYWFYPGWGCDVAGDFNEDGILDVAGLVRRSNVGFTVHFGDGHGGFEPHLDDHTPANSYYMVAADFDRDGHLDVLLVDSDTNVIQVRRGRGDGTFHPAVETATGVAIFQPAVGDFDEDGIPDLATVNGWDTCLTIFTGVGDGHFGPPRTLILGDTPQSWDGLQYLLGGRVNGDTHEDLVISLWGDESDSLIVLYGDGTGGFPNREAVSLGQYSCPGGATIGDLDGDGDADVVVPLQGGLQPAIEIIHNLGDHLGETVSIGLDGECHVAYCPVVADLNGDGLADIAFQYSFEPMDFVTHATWVGAVLGQPGGGYGPLLTSRMSAEGLVLADVDGDGIPDAVAPGLDGLTVAPGMGDGHFGRPAAMLDASYWPQAVAIGDIQGDSGPLDVVAVTGGCGEFGCKTSKIMSWQGTGGDSLVAFNSQNATASRPALLRRMDADARADLLYLAGGVVNLRIGNGDGTFGSPVAITAGATVQGFVPDDLNGDGVVDLACTLGGGQVAILLGTGSGLFQPPAIMSAGSSLGRILSGHLDSGSTMDLAVVDVSGPTLRTLLGNGDGTFATGPARSLGTGFKEAALADLTHDDLADLIAIRNSNVEVAVGNGDGTFGTAGTYGSAGADLRTGDFTGDSNVDVVTTFGNASVCILPGDGTGRLGTRMIFGVGIGPIDIATGDLNGDGRPDIVTANHADGSLTVLLTGAAVTAVPEPGVVPPLFQVGAWPNPTRGPVTVSTLLPTAGPVSVDVFDATGRLVRSLLSGAVRDPGAFSISWDGRGNDGTAVGSGMYLIRVRTPQRALVRKIVRIR